MHHCLCLDEIIRFVAHELVAAKQNATAVALACCCKSFEDPVLDALWGTQCNFILLLKTLPTDIWSPSGYKSLERLPTIHEWTRLRKYAQRIQGIQESGALSLLSSQVLSALRFHALNEPLLPNVRTLRWWFTPETEEVIPFIPLFLSTRTTTIDLIFPGSDLDKVTTASVITDFPTLCPNLQNIRLAGLPRDPMVTAAVSELVLNTKQNTLRTFDVDLTLTEEAYEVICKHHDLDELQVVFDRPITLPTIVLPNLINIDIEYAHGHDWLQGFRGASLEKLTLVTISSESDSIDDLLGAFESVALTTSIPTTLSSFRFKTDRPWRPSYRPLLPFTQLVDLLIESPCEDECSSTIDDDTITNLAQAMPGLELLHLGNTSCETPGGVTVKGLTALAYCCPRLFNLTIHFQAASLDPAEVPHPPYTPESIIPRAGCGLHYLEAGHIRVPEGSELMIAMTLLHVFPHLEEIGYSDCVGWETVSTALHYSRQLAHSRVMHESGT